MKKVMYSILIAVLALSLCACSTQGGEEGQDQEQAAAEEVTTPDADWDIPETTELTDEVRALFDKAMEGLTGVGYEPVGLLGEKDGVYCILCRATVIVPDAKPYYSLVYVSEDGLQNIWDIWMGAHSEKEE
jgi:hypothetical protein